MNFTMYIPCLQTYYTIISCVYFFNSNFLVSKSINAENNLKIANDSEKFPNLHTTQPMWCTAYRKSFEIKLKYESRMYSNSCSFTHNILKLLRRLSGFSTSYVTTCSKSSQTFSIASMYDNMTYVQVSGFME